MANARALYLNAGVSKQLQTADVLVANGLDFLNDGVNPFPATLNLFTATNAITTTVNLLTNLTNAGAKTITIGTVDSTVDFAGNIEVSGDEVVVGDTIFEGTTQIGDAPTDTLDIQAVVISDINFDGTAQAVNNTAANLTVKTTTSGTLALTSAGLLDLDGVGGVTVDNATSGAIAITNTGRAVTLDGGGISIDGTVASNLSTTAADLTVSTITSGTLAVASAAALDMDGVAVTLDATGGFSIDGSGAACNVSATSQNLTLSTVTSGNLILSTTTAGNIDLNSAVDVTIDAGAAGTVAIGATTARPVDLNSTTLDIDATGLVSVDTSNDISLTSTYADVAHGVQLISSGSVYLASAFNTMVNLTNDGYLSVQTTADSTSAQHYAVARLRSDSAVNNYTTYLRVGPGSPSGTVTGIAGDLYLSTSGAPYYCDGGTSWTQVGSATGYSSLQQAYETGNTILTDSSEGALTFTTAESTPIDFTLTSGNFLVTTSATGNAVIDNGTANYLATDHTNSQLELGSATLTVGFLGEVDTDLTFETSGGAKTITGDGTNGLTVTAGASTALTLTSPVAATWSTTAGVLSLTGAGGLTATATAGNVTLTAASVLDFNGGSLDVDVTGSVAIDSSAGGLSIDVVGTSNITTASGNLTIQTSTSGNVSLTAAGYFTLQSDNGGTGPIMPVHTRAASPDGVLAAAQGAVTLVSAGADYGIWVNTNGNTAWSKVVTGDAAETLQEAYNNSSAPALIEMVTNKSMAFETFYSATTPSNFYVRHEGGADSFIATTTTSATAGTVQLGSTNVTVEALNTLAFTGTNRIVQSTSGALTVQTVTSGTLSVTSAGILDLDGTTVNIDGSTAINIGTAADHPVTIESTTLDINASGAVTIDTSSGGISLDAAGLSNFAVTSGDLELSTATSGDISLASVDSFTISGGASSSISVNAAQLSLSTVTSGAIAIQPASTQNLFLTTSGAGGVLTMSSGAGGISATATAGNLSLSTVTSGAINIHSVGNVDVEGTNVLIDASVGFSIDGASASNVSTTAANLTLSTITSGNVIITSAATGDVAITATSDAASDITFQAHASSVYNFNTVADPDLVGFTKTSIIGALNELKADAGSGLVSSYTVGEAGGVAAGDSVYMNADGTIYLSDADALATAKFIGIVKTGAAAAGTAAVYIGGEVTSAAIGGAAPNEGDYVYLSGTAGDVTADAPASGVVLRVGVITNAASNQFVIQVGNPVEL